MADRSALAGESSRADVAGRHLSHAFDVVIESNIPLPELPASEDVTSSVSLWVSGTEPEVDEPCWFYHWYVNENKSEAVMSIAAVSEGFLLRFPGLADFQLNASATSACCRPFATTPARTIRHLFLDQVLPRMLGHQGHLMVHASAVESVDGEGLAFIGGSGWGKSTLALSFEPSQARFLTDDCLKLVVDNGQLKGLPAYPGSRLWSDSIAALLPEAVDTGPVSHYSAKRRVGPGQPVMSLPSEFTALFFLQQPAAANHAVLRVRPLVGGAVVMQLIQNSFLLDVRNSDSTAGQFESIRRLLATGPHCFTLQYPREFSRLSEVRETILAAVAAADRKRHIFDE